MRRGFRPPATGCNWLRGVVALGVPPGVPPPHDGVRLAVLGVVLTLFSRRVILGCVVMLFQLYRVGGVVRPETMQLRRQFLPSVNIDGGVVWVCVGGLVGVWVCVGVCGCILILSWVCTLSLFSKKIEMLFLYLLEYSEPRNEQKTTRTRTLQQNRPAVGG